MPDDVRLCIDSWKHLRRYGFELKLFDDASARQYIEKRYGPRQVSAFDRCRHPAMRSDYLRMCYVLAEGGLYVDADDLRVSDDWGTAMEDGRLKVQALCYDIAVSAMVPSSALSQVDLSVANRIFYVNNNPLAAPPGHPILRRALQRSTNELLGNKGLPEIQSTTGPGNLTAALAAHARQRELKGLAPDFRILFDWEKAAAPCWDLAYRRDSRNWRNMGDE